MFAQGYGKIIHTASMSSIVHCPQPQTVYNTTKAAVKHMAKSPAVEWAARGIRVNSIRPGYTKTAPDLLKTPGGQKYAKPWLRVTPAGRLGKVADLMGAVVYLASETSDFMTGHDMVIDGGICCL